MAEISHKAYKLLVYYHKCKSPQQPQNSEEFDKLLRLGLITRDHLIVSLYDDRPWLYVIDERGKDFILVHRRKLCRRLIEIGIALIGVLAALAALFIN